MSVLAEFIIPANEFVLADTLLTVPEMYIEIQRVVTGEQHVTPYFWASGGDFTTFERAIRQDSTVQEVLTLENHDDNKRFYRVVWQSQSPSLLSALSEAKATIIEAVSEKGEIWEMKILFPSHETLSRFHDFCLEHEIDFEVEHIYHAENPQEAEYGVTVDQQEALVAAFHAGFFRVPRDNSLTELADELGISRNALSARLRRGQHNLLSHTLIHDEEAGE
ncbi:helix-turn-helix domain-containing protein [Haladaptatus pallidirubidus]|uniref:GAF and HTH_10 associated domain-containing protein n=1 Tax=Haladaptatus pallidirubidus TaxID=1008152 RepID=A0AAV3UIS1_9EURY|nr:helix-turn-helix domain-containing protein [Haladaptatus pallidirubidus]